MKAIIGILFAIVSIPAALASQEGAVELNDFSFKSRPTAAAPAIEISGVRTSSGTWKDFKVQAFGKTIAVPAEKLAGLRKSLINGLMVSGESGYAAAGGRTIYVTFLAGFTSGLVERWILSVNEQGDIALKKAK